MGAPLIWPASSSVAENTDGSAPGPWASVCSRMASRSVPPTRRATWNIEGAARMPGERSAGALERSSRRAITAWVVARLPAVRMESCRSPGTPKWKVLGKTEMLSTPALVRVSDIRTSPRLRRRATQ